MNGTKSNNGVSVEQARAILGDKYSHYSDAEIEEILEDLYYLAHSLFDNN